MNQKIDFIIRRIAFSILTLIFILIFNFYLFRIVPGDPVQMLVSPHARPETRENIKRQYGLDKPIWFNFEAARESGSLIKVFDSQFFYYIRNLASGDLGESFRLRRPVSELIENRIGPTILLILTGEITGIVFGIVLGLIAAWKKKTFINTLALLIGLSTWALPAFWLGLVLLIFARGHLPMGELMTPGMVYLNNGEKIKDIAVHLALPASTLALLLFGAYMLIVRNTTLEVLSEDYILTAKAKGLTPIQILRAHALKNASLPLVTIIAMDLGYALGGTIQIETIFSWPGLGRLMFESIGQRDYPVLQAVFLVLAIGVIGANILADLTYAILDPRVKS